MKKMLTTLATLATLTTAANADFIRVEAGTGMWNQKNVGFISYDSDDISGKDTSKESELATNYLWAYVKHPIPIVPNLRVEYSQIKSEGYFTGELKFGMATLPYDGEDIPTTLEMTQIELIPYYNILDNTFWITVDLGLDIKLINYTATGSAVGKVDIYDEDGDFIAPLPYLRARTQLPFMNFGLEAVVKYGAMDGNTFSDINVKLDYTFDFIPLIQPGVEVGYRQIIMDAKSDDKKTVIDLDFSGLYFGVMARF